MLHHVSVGTNDVAKARRFYDAVLGTLSIRLMEVNGETLVYGNSVFELTVAPPHDGKPATVGNGVHIAFAAEDRGAVDRFHAAALANGGSDAGKPGLRPKYNGNYYGAFAYDPDGNKIEAVTYSAE